MAGAGKKTFTAGEVLTASDVNTYLMEQSVMVFGGTAARSSAIPTPSTGMTTYNQETKQLESYNGTDFIGMSGLQLIKKQTVGTGVTSVSVTSAFSATYPNYRIIYSGGASSTNTDIQFSLDGITTGYNSSFLYSQYGSATANAATQSNQSNISWLGYCVDATVYLDCDVLNPNVALHKIVRGYGVNTAGSGSTTGLIKSTSTATAFTIAAQTGTITGGTVYVYGYGL
jgi:hypothetical protein